MKVLCMLLPVTLLLASCKYLSFSEVLTRNAQAPQRQDEPCFLALSSGSQCRMSAKQCSRTVALLQELKNSSEKEQKDILKDSFVQSVINKKMDSADACDPSLEDWANKTLALNKPAPYDVATLMIPNLQELKLLVWAGGMMAGFMGDGIGSACMSALGAGISYGESKQWISCRR